MKKIHRKPATIPELLPLSELGFFTTNVPTKDSGTSYRLSFSQCAIA